MSLRKARASDAEATRSDLPQGTLDLLILKVLAPEPLHGYGIAQRLQQVSRDVVQVQQGSIPRSIASSSAAISPRRGRRPTPGATPSSTASPNRARRSSRAGPRAGSG